MILIFWVRAFLNKKAQEYESLNNISTTNIINNAVVVFLNSDICLLKLGIYSNISVGDFPKCFLNTVLKYPMLENPQSSLTSVTVYFRDWRSSKD